MGNSPRDRVAKTPDLVAKFRRHFPLCSAPFTRTFPFAATGKPDAAREGRRFWKRNPAPPEPDRGFGFEPGSEVPRDGGSGPTAERREGTSEPLRRDGGPIGTSAGNGWGFDPRGLGTEASAEGPGCRSSSGDVRHRNGRKARPGHDHFGGRGEPEGRKAGWRPDGRKTRRRPTKGRPGVGAGRQQPRLRSERRRNPERAMVSAGASSGFSAFGA